MPASVLEQSEEAERLSYVAAINVQVQARRRRNPPRFAVHVCLTETERDPAYAAAYAGILAEHGGDEDAALDEVNEASDEPRRCYSRRERAMRYADRAAGFVLERRGLRRTVGADGWGEWEWDEEWLLAADTGEPWLRRG